MLKAFIRGRGRVECDLSCISLCDGIKLPEKSEANRWKLTTCYNNNKSWSLSLPRFDTNRISIKENRYYIRTKYPPVLEIVNKLTHPFADYIYDNRESLGVSKTHEEIVNMLTKNFFVARTLHSNVFIDINTNKQMDLSNSSPRIRVGPHVRPVVYINGDNISMEFELVRVVVWTNLGKEKESNEIVAVSEKKSKRRYKKKAMPANL